MAVAAGGTLDQHTPDLVGHEQHSPGGDAFGDIEVTWTRTRVLHTILGPAVTVRCHHHQSVRSHPGYVATARAADGTAGGDGGRGQPASAWASSGTPKPAATSASSTPWSARRPTVDRWLRSQRREPETEPRHHK